jgi:glycosyltransferase involved in cell wall biosynthesis
LKILYTARLFSGLEDSFYTKIWKPTGVPTIYKIIEEIDKHHTPRFLFTSKDSGQGCFSLWGKSSDQEIIVSGLKHSVCVISGVNFFPAWLGRKTRIILREIRQSLFIIIELIKFKPDIIYCDHANVLIGGILSRIQNRIPVVFRVMGADDFMRQCLTPDSLVQKIYKWVYKSPFDLVLCTQDGSGVELWVNSALSDTVKREVLLNGTDVAIPPSIVDQRLLNIPNNKIIILFVGKLEKYKGCYEFVKSILLLKHNYNNVHALIIGAGSEDGSLKRLIKKDYAENYFTFIDRLPHSQIFAAHSISDIYVSMNHFGNLSNANLEAFQSDSCIIMPYSQPEKGIDIETDRIISDAVIKVAIKDHVSLFYALTELVESEKKRLSMSHAISEIKQDFLWSWRERIDKEMELLKILKNS